MEFNTHVIAQNWHLLLDGARMTIVMCGVSLGIGAIFGLLLCLAKLTQRGIIYLLSSFFIDIFRTIPEVVPIFWMYYCAPILLNFLLSAEAAGILALTFISSAYLAEIFRAGIEAIPKGQIEASKALGIPTIWVWAIIIAPQAWRMMVPPLINLVCDIVKISGLLSIIGIAELVYRSATISGETYRYLELYSVVGLVYFLIIYPLSLFARYRERIVTKNLWSI